MPELRKDPIIGRWVIIATERARRPGNFVHSNDLSWDDPHISPCPYCQHLQTPLYWATLNRPSQGPHDWDVCVTSHETPILNMQGSFERRGYGLYDVIDGYGTHEVVVETKEHIANMADLSEDQIRLVLETYAHRINELEKNSHLQYVLAYKNYGISAGSRKIGHARSHIIAAPVNPRRIKDKLMGAKKYFGYHDRCVYCDLIHTELDQKKRIIFETEHFVALTPFAARFLFEVWILPKKHHCDFYKGLLGSQHDLAKMLKKVLMKIELGLGDPAYNFVIHTAPFRRSDFSGNRFRTIEEDYHWHIEILPRLTTVAGFEKGTGFYICSVPPEAMTEYLGKF